MAQEGAAPTADLVARERVSLTWDLVIPTLGRDSLRALLGALAECEPRPARIVIVDDRRAPRQPLLERAPAALAPLLRIIRSGGLGPAAARNIGWRACASPWVAFLDDDVLPPRDWARRLVQDLTDLPPQVGGSQGRIQVPLPEGRRPTDWERNVAGLEGARWATADMAYRRSVLEAVGGFDERFPRAYREDADLGLRVTAAGYAIVEGERVIEHPVRPADPWVSVRLQAGNADDSLMAALHGRAWRRRAGAAPGRRPSHLVVTGALGVALAALALQERALALGAALVWLLGTVELAWARIAPGPRDAREVLTMVATSLVLPLAATYHWVRGLLLLPGVLARPPSVRSGGVVPAHVEAVLLDRDGTLIVDVPYNGDPARVRPKPGVAETLARLRARGIKLAVVTNQSGIGRGLLTRADVDAVNARVEELLGPFEGFFVCPHAPDEGCACRKPEPGLILQACRRLGVSPLRCVVIGDIAADVEAAHAAGAHGVLVPTEVTLPEEVRSAPVLAADIAAAIDRLPALGRKLA